MQSAAQAYARTAQTTAAPRELEAQLLLKAAARLQALKDAAAPARGETIEALRYNRKLWTLFVSSVTRAENPLPLAIKQNVANLAAFVLKHTVMLESEPEIERVGILIRINREVAAGLSGQA